MSHLPLHTNQRDRLILRLAVPSIVSNITVPLLGMVDVAIVGHLGNAAYIGAVAVGSMVFNLLYWLFGFLRMGTSGATAQALGRRDLPAVGATLMRSVATALLIATAIIVLQVPLLWLMFLLIGPTADVAPWAAVYFRIVVWGAPASLVLFCLNGWFIGMQNTRTPMVVSILQNVVNIVASVTLVYGFGMRLEGVAAGTVVAQYTSLAVAVGLLAHYYGRRIPFGGGLTGLGSLRRGRVLKLFSAQQLSLRQDSPNRDIFLRTLCLVAVNLFFTSAGARQGAVILSANTVLLQLYLLFSYFMDGFAYAGEALCGRYYGAGNGEAFRQTLRHLFGWMTAVTVAYTLLYIWGGTLIVALLTDEPQVRLAAADYVVWAWLIPAAGCTAFIWDGVFVGMMATRGMLASSAAAALTFFGVYGLALVALPSGLLNHGLWMAQVVYLATRGLLQTVWFRRNKLCPSNARF